MPKKVISQEAVEFIKNNYQEKTIKQITDEINVSPNQVKKVLKKNNLVSPFKYKNDKVNHYYSDASFTCFKFSVKRMLKTGLTDPDAIFVASVVDFCLDSGHDIKIAKVIFKDYFYNELVPILDDLPKEEMYISVELLKILSEGLSK